nr:hypothetical protein [Bradyrhizobium diazoefficiens]
MKSAEWKGMAVAAAVAFLSTGLLAADAALDLSASGFARRLESARASIADAMGRHRPAFTIQAWARRISEKRSAAIE